MHIYPSAASHSPAVPESNDIRRGVIMGKHNDVLAYRKKGGRV